MKNLTLFLFFTLLLSACKHPQKAKPEQITHAKKDVTILLENWHLAATQANYNGYFNAMDSLSVFIGTDAGENWTKSQFQNFSKPYFDKGKAWDFKTLERNIYLNETANIAWFDELLNTWMGTCRGSGVLEKTDNTWKLKHYVLSLTIPNDDIKAVINAKKKNDSLFLQKRFNLLND